MAILDETSKFITNQTQAAIYGSFKESFDPSEFERDRDDGVTILDLTPDCRIFIGGAEVTNDLDSVNITHSIEGSKCTVLLNNPRGKYEITKMDLMKKWREDKDILSNYDYKHLKKSDPINFDKLASKLGDGILGTGGGGLVGESIDLAKSGYSALGGFMGAVPKVRGVTRMLFETKFYSGITRRIGDIVFDYRDPVIVFMKGRFSPYWYFVFTGIVVSYSDVDAYGESNMLTLNCEDTLSLWKRTKLTTKAAFYGMSNLENRILTSSYSTRSLPVDFGTNMTFLQMLKAVAFTADYGQKAMNCHITKSRDTKSLIDVWDDDNYKTLKNLMHKGAKIDKSMKVTNAGILNTIYRRVTDSEAVGAINASKIQYKDMDGNVIFKGGPNDYPLSPATAIYFQLNDITFAKGSFDGRTINRALDLSVRYWERDHEINTSFDPENSVGTGWKNNKAFGVCGINPAMKYAFLDNFNILESVWSQYYNKGQSSVENCVMSLYDKIYETVIGSPTEMVVNGTSSSTNSAPVGTNLNLFRPRLFVLSPHKYSGLRKLSGNFSNLGKLFEESSTTYYEFLKTKLKPIEYNFFSSPSGDVFIEPDLYDFHPLEFSDKIEARDIIKNEDDIEFSAKTSVPVVEETDSNTVSAAGTAGTATGGIGSEGMAASGTTKEETVSGETGPGDMPGQTRMVRVKGKAYFFNSKANHPFFIMEKDRIRSTYEFSVDKIVSAVEVIGSQSLSGGVTESVYSTSANQQFLRDVKSMSEGNAQNVKKSSTWIMGRYIADGFDALTSLGEAAKQEFEAQKALYEELINVYKNYIFIRLLSDEVDTKISDFVVSFAKGIVKMNPQTTTSGSGGSSPAPKVEDFQRNWNRIVQDNVVKYLYGRSEAERYDDSTQVFIIDSYCKELKIAAGIGENVISLADIKSKILDKKISDFLFINTARKENKDKDFENLTIEISKLKSKNDSSKKDEKSTTDSNVDLLIQDFAAKGAFSFDGSTDSGSPLMGSTRGIVSNLVLLYEGTLLSNNSDNTITKMAKDLEELENQSILPRQFRAMTIANLRKIQRQGYYNPRENLISLYGFKRMEPIRNEYIRNGEEANTYARHVFNRILGDSRSVNTTIVGRPELQLNRPYYFERKDCIGLLRQYNISYKYGSDFSSTLTLGYIRNNTLSYDYSLGELDTIKGINDNAYFSEQGKEYLQMQKTMQQTNQLAGQSVGSAVTKSLGGGAGGIFAGQLTGGATTDILNTVQIGGLYSAHDFLGHMNYDDRGQEPSATLDDNISGSLNQILPPHFTQAIMKYCQEIESALKSYDEIEKDMKKLENEEKTKAKNDLDKVKQDIQTQTNTANTSSDQAEKVKALLEIRKLNQKSKKLENSVKTIDAKVNTDKKKLDTLQSRLYGDLLNSKRGGKGIIKNNQSLTNAIKAQFGLTQTKNMEYYGLFYSLFCSHVSVLAIKTTDEDYKKLTVCCDKPEGVGAEALFKGSKQTPSSSFKYYIELSR